MTKEPQSDLQQLLAARYSDAPALDATPPGADALCKMAARGSCRAFQDKPVPAAWVDMLCAVALASPTKSDLQQRDIVLLRSAEVRQALAGLVAGQAWVANAPMVAHVA